MSSRRRCDLLGAASAAGALPRRGLAGARSGAPPPTGCARSKAGFVRVRSIATHHIARGGALEDFAVFAPAPYTRAQIRENGETTLNGGEARTRLRPGDE